LSSVPIRKAIGLSSSVMVVTAAAGAIAKIATLEQHDIGIPVVGMMAAALIPGAVVGSYAGAKLVHTLKTPTVQLVVSAIMVIAGIKLILS
jgi:uncharacterized membrane protein YfcA